MAAVPSWLRPWAVMLVAAGMLGSVSGCKRGSGETAGTVSITGTVTYTRAPILYDANGSPTGLGDPATAGVVTPARNVVVRAFQLFWDVDSSGSLVPTWRLAGSAATDLNGDYTISDSAYGGYATFVEVESVFQQQGGDASTVKVVGVPAGLVANDPGGIRSALPEPSRPIYAYREDINGNPFTDPTDNPGSLPVQHDDATVNFTLGASATWALTSPTWYVPGSTAQAPVGTVDVGSRVLAILDSVFYFTYYYGDPTPSQTPGGILDLHYYPGQTETPRRSYVVYNPDLFYNAATNVNTAFDGATLHYFGTLAGGPAVDDAYDPGVIYPLLARNFLFGQGKTSLFPYGQGTASFLLPNLAPDLAVVEGLGDALAANLLQTPFLTDLSAATALAPRDIRVLPAQNNIYTPTTVAAAGWQLNLTGQGVVGAGDPAVWKVLAPSNTWIFFSLIYPTITFQANAGPATIQTDIASFYTQVGRLQENHPEDPINLGNVFPDSVLIPLLANPFDILWPGKDLWPLFADNWGVNPNSSLAALPGFTLSRAQAEAAGAVPNPNVVNPVPATVYLNESQGEVHYAKLALTLDRAYALSFTTVPDLVSGTPLPPGAGIEVVVDGNVREPLVFNATQSAAQTMVLRGNPTDTSNPAWHWVRIRLVSPDPSTTQPDIQVTVNLTPLS